ncbi:MAG: pilus assembly protein [Lachnospiraceae bacterium]|nr:pilus assembly protein [Lachnospiraceae bacterium]
MEKEVKSAAGGKRLKGSFTVEAAIVLPVVLFCICLMMKRGIILYTATVQVINRQEIWQEFHPAKEFRKLELLKELL